MNKSLKNIEPGLKRTIYKNKYIPEIATQKKKKKKKKKIRLSD